MMGSAKASRRKHKRERLPQGRVFLSEPAFIALVAAAAEAYRKECYGILLGDRRRGRTYIRTAFAYQTARRSTGSVDLGEGRRRIIRNILCAFPRYNFVGEFHSHPDYGGKPGDTTVSASDLIGVRPGECEFVMAIRRSGRTMPWQYCADGTLSGNGGGFFIKMKAFMAEYMQNGRLRARGAGLRCEYAVRTANSRRLLDLRRREAGP